MRLTVQDDRLEGKRVFTVTLTKLDQESFTPKKGDGWVRQPILPSEALHNLYLIAKAQEQEQLAHGGRLPS